MRRLRTLPGMLSSVTLPKRLAPNNQWLSSPLTAPQVSLRQDAKDVQTPEGSVKLGLGHVDDQADCLRRQRSVRADEGDGVFPNKSDLIISIKDLRAIPVFIASVRTTSNSSNVCRAASRLDLPRMREQSVRRERDMVVRVQREKQESRTITRVFIH